MPACLKPMTLQSPTRIVPCGKCPYCLQNKRQDWVFRLQQENKIATSAIFVTLTYHPKYLSWKNGKSQLNKRHLQLFIKRIRRAHHRSESTQIRYYAVGEYGTKTSRPHYHILLFNYQEDNKIQSHWPRGQVHIGTVSDASIAYTTKYVIQSRDTQQRDGRVPPFALMSRRPAIGNNYLTPAIKNWHLEDDRFYTYADGIKISLPRYYRDKIFTKRQKKLHQIRSILTAETDLRKKLLDLAKRGQRDPYEYYNAMRLRNSKLVKQKVAYTQSI